MKNFWQLIKYALASGSSFLLDIGLFYLFQLLLGERLGVGADMICTILARVVSSFFNFNVNNRLVFGHKGDYFGALLRYYCLAVPMMLVSGGMVTLLDRLFGVSAPALRTAVKIVVDTLLFIASYLIQKGWVFAEKKTGESGSQTERNA